MQNIKSLFPIGGPFEEPFLVPGRTLSGYMLNPFHSRFYLEPKGVLPGTKNGSPMGTAKEPFWTHIFLRV
jgi:hypothetical protein